MSFFGKLKNLHCGPPVPPKRIDINAGCDLSEDDLDQEDGDTYEAPPCERPTIKIQNQQEENVYLGYPKRPPYSINPQRQAIPPPRPAKITPKMKSSKPLFDQEEFYIDSKNRKCHEYSSKDLTVKKLAPRKSPPEIKAPYLEEDLYLDPNESQTDREPIHDIYVEPTAECPPVPHGGIHMLPSKAIMRDLPLPVMKPHTPRAKSNCLISSESMNTASLQDMKFHTIADHVGSPVQNLRPSFGTEAIKDAKPSSPISPTIDNTAPVKYPGEQEMGLEGREWFAGICGRKTAEDTLLKVNKDGSFMVRCSTAQNEHQPFTLVVLFNQKVYNIPVRFVKDSCSYALGKEGKKCEELFSSLHEMISYHKHNPLLLIDSKSQAKHTTYLTHAIHL